MKAPEALLFDFGGTLDADGVPWKDRFRSVAGYSGSPEAFDRAYYAADDALVGTVPRELSFRDTVELLSRNLVRELRLDAQKGPPVAEIFYQTSLAKAEASRQILGRLAQRYRLGIVSNFYGNLAQVCDEIGIAQYVGAVIDSAVVGFEKPDPRIFQAALAALEVSADRAVFIGDSLPRDMDGARRLGMPHVWVQPGARTACCPGDAVIGNVSQLLEVLP